MYLEQFQKDPKEDQDSIISPLFTGYFILIRDQPLYLTIIFMT